MHDFHFAEKNFSCVSWHFRYFILNVLAWVLKELSSRAVPESLSGKGKQQQAEICLKKPKTAEMKHTVCQRGSTKSILWAFVLANIDYRRRTDETIEYLKCGCVFAGFTLAERQDAAYQYSKGFAGWWQKWCNQRRRLASKLPHILNEHFLFVSHDVLELPLRQRG